MLVRLSWSSNKHLYASVFIYNVAFQSILCNDINIAKIDESVAAVQLACYDWFSRTLNVKSTKRLPDGRGPNAPLDHQSVLHRVF